MKRQLGPLSCLLALSCLVGNPQPAQAGFPSPVYPGCGEDESLANCPPDMLNEDGSWRGITWSFVSFIKPEYQRSVRPQELELGSGNWIDKAFQLTVGRYDVPIAVVDSGIRWRHREITDKVLLNPEELPAPLGTDGAVCANRDCNGDGWFTVADYAADSRVSADMGSDDATDFLEPSDLIAAFSNGIDEDENGYIDDIAGWDFMWDNNDPKSSTDFGHGTGVMSDAAATAGDYGSDMGYCPNCAIIPIRVGDSFMGEGNRIAQGITYAVDRGAKVIGIALGGITNSPFLQDAFEYAYSKNVTIIAAIGDELSYHHLPPGINEYTIPVHSIEFWPIYDQAHARSFIAYNGCNNYGAHLMLVSATNDCATGAVATISGVAGLVYSRALDKGLVLTADEVRAMLTQSATDIDVEESRRPGSPYFPSRKGWDQFFGYGRVNARHAVDLARPYAVPPEVHIRSPRWYEYVDPRVTSTLDIEGYFAANRAIQFSYDIEWAPGSDVADVEFQHLYTGTSSRAIDGTLYRWSLADIPVEELDPAAPLEAISGADPLLDKLKKVNAHAVTIRVTVTDDMGNRAEHRKTFFLHEDPDLVSGFPRYVGPGESSPLIVDLDGDGAGEILLANSAGQIHAFKASGQEAAGWPVEVDVLHAADETNPENHLDQAAYSSQAVTPSRQGILGNVTAADLDGDGKMEVMVSTLEGSLYVYSSTGQLRSGFPVHREAISDEDTDPTHQFDPGIAASPTAADLDGDGKLEIILPAMDQKIYVWTASGQYFPGFPVFLATDRSEEYHTQGRIFSTAVVGDITGDERPEIVVGTNEYDSTLPFITYAYALYAEGNQHLDGPIVAGWPATVIGLLSGVIPFMGDGITMTPVLVDIDGDGKQEVAVASTGGAPTVLDGSGKILVEMSCDASGWGAGRDTREVGALPYIANLGVADLDLDGDPDLVAGMTAENWAISLGLNRWMPYQDHLVAAWDIRTGLALDAWPRVIEDIAMFVKPDFTDVDGDGFPEVLMSSGGYVLHAWNSEGLEPAGWPKLTGGWIYTAIRTGDLTGDASPEVVALTREGYLWAWHTADAATRKGAPVPGLRGADFTQSSSARRPVSPRPPADTRSTLSASDGTTFRR